MSTCPYPTKRSWYTRELACTGARQIMFSVEARGETYTPLHPYRCPNGDHWHLSSATQGVKPCPRCGDERAAWFDKNNQQWVVYAHGDCPTQAVRPGFYRAL